MGQSRFPGIGKRRAGFLALWVAIALMGPVFASSDYSTHTVEIVVRLPSNTPSQSSIYLTGDTPETCHWNPACLKMEKVADLTYRARLDFSSSRQRLQFKITRGTWATEAAAPNGAPLPNSNLAMSLDGSQALDQTLISVSNWKDNRPLGVTGSVQVIPAFFSPELGNSRNLAVWLPPGYEKFPDRRYPVIYMHDGQNLFDPATSSTGVDWGIDETLTRLITQQGVRSAIVVGLSSTADRMAEYDYTLRGELYGRFLIETVKPYVDLHFRTRPERDSTYVMGSSMGGNISFALLWMHPEVFSRAAALSLAAPINGEAIFKTLQETPVPSQPVRFYLDVGTDGLDATFAPEVEKFERALLNTGFDSGSLFYQVFPYANHQEADWERRAAIPLRYLLK